MALTQFQRDLCRLIAQNRIAQGEAYVAGGVALTEALHTARISRDSAFRFFPLVEHPDLGLTLHPFDLATNKVLALVGRAEARDWVDVIDCHRFLQPLGYLMWAACGKDPSMSPSFILDEAARTTRYTQVELADLAFGGPTPDARDLAQQWKEMLKQARGIHAILPSERAGCCVLGPNLELYTGSSPSLAQDLGERKLIFHEGRIEGVWPTLLPQD